MALTQKDLQAIGNLIDERLEIKLEEKLESKLEEKLDSKLEEKLDRILDAKFDEKLIPFETRIKQFVNDRVTMAVSELGAEIDERIGRLVKRSNEYQDILVRHDLDINMLKKLATAESK